SRRKFDLGKDVRDWQVNYARKDLQSHYPNDKKLIKISYRPFEDKYTFYTGKSKGFHCYPRNEVMQNFVNRENLGLATIRINKEDEFSSVFITKNLADARLSDRFMTSIYPLYLYPETNGEQSLSGFETL
ncbi:type ISP restriction/modification enzyme, partial [Flavobacterium sp. UBA6046]|uniref:type ISP restriction/modification enzyme n=1 Tax=Flavobacterium sp. UBA6046 TaxID=1946552 RepID=UPI0032E38C27